MAHLLLHYCYIQDSSQYLLYIYIYKNKKNNNNDKNRRHSEDTTAVLFMSLLRLQDTRFCKIHTHLNSDGNNGQQSYFGTQRSIQMFTLVEHSMRWGEKYSNYRQENL